jgi:hypothetical protein
MSSRWPVAPYSGRDEASGRVGYQKDESLNQASCGGWHRGRRGLRADLSYLIVEPWDGSR